MLFTDRLEAGTIIYIISEKDKNAICEISKKYHAKQVLLFGSSLSPDKESCDIDIEVEGILPECFFKYYGDLMFALSKPVDATNLYGSSKFIEPILSQGVPLYA